MSFVVVDVLACDGCFCCFCCCYWSAGGDGLCFLMLVVSKRSSGRGIFANFRFWHHCLSLHGLVGTGWKNMVGPVHAGPFECFRAPGIALAPSG